jgi:hypothetical protein
MDVAKLREAALSCKYPNEKLMLEALDHIAQGINMLIGIIVVFFTVILLIVSVRFIAWLVP